MSAHSDSTRTVTAKATTLSRRTARKLKYQVLSFDPDTIKRELHRAPTTTATNNGSNK